MADVSNKKNLRILKGDVRYLALEGGGGKGVTYIGAIEQLQLYNLLPIQHKTFYSGNQTYSEEFGTSRILGISGSSAGAITALMLALGMSAAQIRTLLKEKAKDFEDFCDVPFVGVHRIYNDGKYKLTNEMLQMSLEFKRNLSEKMGRVYKISDSSLLETIGLKYLPTILKLFNIKTTDFPLSKILGPGSPRLGFLNALFMDGGLFLGRKNTEFFNDLISHELLKFFELRKPVPHFIGFDEFKRITNVDLRITGANIYTNKPMYFSAVHTPQFPVALAVSISMNIPILFKPIIIDSHIRDGRGKLTDEYKGLWVDGGLLNNLPLHAFDKVSSNITKGEDEGLYPLNKNILALRLMDGSPAEKDSKRFNFTWDKWINHSGIGPMAGMLFSTLLYPSEEGQIRTPLEEEHTIKLYTYNLSMLNFSPSPEESKKPIDEAKKSVKDYFESSS